MHQQIVRENNVITPEINVTRSAERLAETRGGGTNTMDTDSGQTISPFCLLSVAGPEKGEPSYRRLSGLSPVCNCY